ncbi:hypothetical protein HKX48_006775 [Thoreauomyces humboldtii]|nr:hypothetical protein HKX48_006775 [Thoreauomyces humboldtii]
MANHSENYMHVNKADFTSDHHWDKLDEALDGRGTKHEPEWTKKILGLTFLRSRVGDQNHKKVATTPPYGTLSCPKTDKAAGAQRDGGLESQAK